MSDTYVTDLLQDSLGFMWFATREGLQRYDGYRFRHFRHSHIDSSGANDVKVLYLDRDGLMWIGGNTTGIHLFDPLRETMANERINPRLFDMLAGKEVIGFCDDGIDNMWIITVGSQPNLYRYQRSLDSCFVYGGKGDAHEAPRGILYHIDATRDGHTWIGTKSSGLVVYDPQRDLISDYTDNPRLALDGLSKYHVAVFSHRIYAPDTQREAADPSIPAQPPFSSGLRSMFIDDNNIVWAGGYADVFCYDTVRDSVWRFPIRPRLDPADRFAEIKDLLIDRDNILWILFHQSGPVAIDLETEEIYYRNRWEGDESEATLRVEGWSKRIAEDRNGVIWITTDEGLYQISKRRRNFHQVGAAVRSRSGLCGARVRSIMESSKGEIYIGTTDGLSLRSGESDEFRCFRKIEGDTTSLPNDIVNYIFEDSQGRIWLATNWGFCRFDPHSQSFDRHGLLVIHGLWAIEELNPNDLLVGSLGRGLVRYNPVTGQRRVLYVDAGDTSNVRKNRILCIRRVADGTVYIGTDEGMSIFDPVAETFRLFRHEANDPTSLSDDRVWYIHKGRAASLWLATAGGGINKFDGQRESFTSFDQRSGLSSNVVCGILEDSKGKLWISTLKGLSVFDPQRETFTRTINARDLGIEEFHFKACLRSRSGEMFFGGKGGVVRFHPDSLRQSRTAPAAFISEFEVAGVDYRADSSIACKAGIRLEHDENFFTMRFSTLNYSTMISTKYEYQLEGFDPDWRIAGETTQEAVYTNVPPARYLFRLRSKLHDNQLAGAETHLLIDIRPAFWQQLWFRAGVSVLLLALLATPVVLRIQYVRNRSELRTKLRETQLKTLRAQMNPHFMFNTLNSIVNYIAHNDSDAAISYLTAFARLMRATLENSRRDISTLDEELKALEWYLTLEAMRFRGRFTYSIDIEEGLPLDDVAVPPLLIQPFVENAIKHGLMPQSGPGSLLITIEAVPDAIQCKVRDSGIGRAKAAELKRDRDSGHRSHGLEVTAERFAMMSELYRGDFSFAIADLHDSSGRAAGTEVTIMIPNEAE